MTPATSMRASFLVRPGLIELREVPVPSVEPDEVLVRMESVGVCGSDVHYYREGRIGNFVVESPLILGHEASGTIIAVGAGVDPGRVGHRVAIEPQQPCRRCDQCRRGRYNLCAEIQFYATPPVDGAFTELQTIHADAAFRIPDTLSFDAAALCEPLSVAIWANRKAGAQPGQRLLIAGAGPIGLLTTQVALAFGAAEVIVTDTSLHRRQVASRYGATAVIDPAQEDIASLNLDVDAFIDASGAQAAIRAGIAALRPAGRAVLVGMGADDMSLPVSLVQSREIELAGVFRYANTWPLAIQLASSGRIDLDSLVTSTFDLAHTEDALISAGKPETLKAVVHPNRS